MSFSVIFNHAANDVFLRGSLRKLLSNTCSRKKCSIIIKRDNSTAIDHCTSASGLISIQQILNNDFLECYDMRNINDTKS